MVKGRDEAGSIVGNLLTIQNFLKKRVLNLQGVRGFRSAAYLSTVGGPASIAQRIGNAIRLWLLNEYRDPPMAHFMRRSETALGRSVMLSATVGKLRVMELWSMRRVKSLK
jgi:hypothetical protein